MADNVKTHLKITFIKTKPQLLTLRTGVES
jgi:hypothetical protein